MSLENAACRGMHELFDSTDLADHFVAASICEQCPVLTECRAELNRVASLAATIAEQGGGPVGTWAGHLIGSKAAHKPFQARCGTNSGYQRHRRAGEQPCAACIAGHRRANKRVSLA